VLHLRRVQRLPGQAGHRRGDQRPAHLHEEVREDQRGTGVEQRSRVVQPSQVFPERRPVRPTVQRLEESHTGDRQQRLPRMYRETSDGHQEIAELLAGEKTAGMV